MYQIQPPASEQYYYAWCNKSFGGFQWTVCPECGRRIATMQYVSDVPYLLIDGGPKYSDYLCYTDAGIRLFLISERTLNLFEQHNVSGYDEYCLVELEFEEAGKVIDNIPRYYALNLIGSVEFDFKQMHLKKKKFCQQCGSFEWSRTRLDPAILDMSTWDGSDLCTIKSIPGRKVCTEKVRELVKEHTLTGFNFTKLL